ncbi:MEKHLA domain-containing protein [Ferriphaselus sp. R-1]|uniref:MEKHLA domain-containing protein n=1 Tax=Ferriphaselus sp. R-1 TaxID=1485544 RepID=UPI0005583D2A|nr:MEKHLA domain-containing protein [Ferriphaselus sp. R-1]
MPESIKKPVISAELDARLHLIFDSFHRLTGRVLVESNQHERLSDLLWDAPRAILAHGTEADPVFFYGNRLALELFELDFAAFTRLPSRYSAEPLAREARARLLERVTQHGYIDDYSGVRISSSGKRFRIERVIVWNLLDEAGKLHGQAATFTEWLGLPD